MTLQDTSQSYRQRKLGWRKAQHDFQLRNAVLKMNILKLKTSVYSSVTLDSVYILVLFLFFVFLTFLFIQQWCLFLSQMLQGWRCPGLCDSFGDGSVRLPSHCDLAHLLSPGLLSASRPALPFFCPKAPHGQGLSFNVYFAQQLLHQRPSLGRFYSLSQCHHPKLRNSNSFEELIKINVILFMDSSNLQIKINT